VAAVEFWRIRFDANISAIHFLSIACDRAGIVFALATI